MLLCPMWLMSIGKVAIAIFGVCSQRKISHVGLKLHINAVRWYFSWLAVIAYARVKRKHFSCII